MAQINAKISPTLRRDFAVKCATSRMTKAKAAEAAITEGVADDAAPVAPPDDAVRWAVDVTDDTFRDLKVYAARRGVTTPVASHTFLFNWTYGL